MNKSENNPVRNMSTTQPIKEEESKNNTEIDSEQIEDDSILDSEEQEEIIENVDNENAEGINNNEQESVNYFTKEPSNNDTSSVKEENKKWAKLEGSFGRIEEKELSSERKNAGDYEPIKGNI